MDTYSYALFPLTPSLKSSILCFDEYLKKEDFKLCDDFWKHNDSIEATLGLHLEEFRDSRYPIISEDNQSFILIPTETTGFDTPDLGTLKAHGATALVIMEGDYGCEDVISIYKDGKAKVFLL